MFRFRDASNKSSARRARTHTHTGVRPETRPAVSAFRGGSPMESSRISPATRNRARDHLIAAAVYSQMLYQLSYSRLARHASMLHVMCKRPAPAKPRPERFMAATSQGPCCVYGQELSGALTAGIPDLDWHAQASITVHAQLKHMVNIPLRSLSRHDQGAVHRASEDCTSVTRRNATFYSEKR